MKKLQHQFVVGFLLVAFVLLHACDKDDPADVTRTYALEAVGGSGVSGTITFYKVTDTTTLVTVILAGTQSPNSHPAHIHENNAETGGSILIDLNDIDGATGRSETTVSRLNSGASINFNGLINLNGHVNVHKSAAELNIVVTQGNIGSNTKGTPGTPIGY